VTRFDAIALSTNINPWRRRADKVTTIGLSGETFDAGVIVGSTTLASQTVKATGEYLYAGEVVTNVWVIVQQVASGTAPTLFKLGLWNSAATPVCAAVTAELKDDASWTGSQGYKSFVWAGGAYTVPSDGLYYFAALMNGAFGTTNLQLACGTTGVGASNAVGSNRRRHGALGTGITSMAVNDTGTYSSVGSPIWFGWS
jgi:hypothetical protein